MMEMNKLWKAADFKALAKRLSFATGMITPNASGADAEQLAFVAHACKLFLAEYEKAAK